MYADPQFEFTFYPDGPAKSVSHMVELPFMSAAVDLWAWLRLEPMASGTGEVYVSAYVEDEGVRMTVDLFKLEDGAVVRYPVEGST